MLFPLSLFFSVVSRPSFIFNRRRRSSLVSFLSIIGRTRPASWFFGSFSFLLFCRLKILNSFLCFLNPQFAIIEFMAIIVHRLSRPLIAIKCYECKTPILSCLSVFRQSHCHYSPTISEQVSQIFLCATVR